MPLAASAHEDSAKHDHGTDAHAQVPQGVDKVLTPEQIDLSSGKAILDANDHYNVRILRIQIPANKELQPHGPKEGYFFVNAISGTLQLGFGNTYDASKLQTLPPGSIFTHPAGQQHFAKTGNEPVVLQITAINPHGGKKHDHHHHDAPATSALSPWAAIIAIGIRPCSGAVISLAAAWSWSLIGAGIAMTLAIACGTALTIATIALLCYHGRQHLARRLTHDGARLARLTRTLALAGGLILILLGALLWQSDSDTPAPTSNPIGRVAAWHGDQHSKIAKKQ